MAPRGKAILTYHVVPRFDIAAEGGPLSLGTIVANLQHLVPLNRGFHVEVPEALKYTPVCQTQFRETLIKAREANFGAWLKAIGIPVGGSVIGGGSRDLESSVSCDSIVTTYFDPDNDYFQKCLATRPIQDWVEASNHFTANLYMITGLKVAKNLKFNASRSTEKHGKAELQVNEPHTGAVEGGVSVDASGGTKKATEFSVDDIIIAYRVNHYACSQTRWFGKHMETKDKGLLTGDLMNHEQKEAEQPEMTFEPLSIPEEVAAQERAMADGSDECWV
ncbi:hypothetical protein X797_009406 [Metarhizium robertsii]|uniref:Uncharacterized protein n=2 Tax=Metarhizium robertsii TaxID=568076 RepID=E9F3A0_METRA|nr:uncharacterized protein MAA_06749 [Metarhizium robertsii ARSEF 23]EFY97966.1 hypothetical protein MAA_06749 [Metarhizium robertsii ARSEF 23]EXU97497.1 hypothetical protein X797_009406 [Metarhizium robertsii]